MNFRRSKIVADLWRPEVSRRSTYSRNLCFFKTTPYGKFSKFCFERFYRNTDRPVVFKFSKIWLEIGKIVHYLPDKKNKIVFGFAVAARIATKICQGQPQAICSQCSRFHPNRFTFGGVIAKRANTTKTRRKVNSIFGWSLSWSKITIHLNFDHNFGKRRPTYKILSLTDTWGILF